MCAAKHIITLDQQTEKLVGSDLWDPAFADGLLQTSSTPLQTIPEVPESPDVGEESDCEVISTPSHVTSTSLLRPNKRRSVTGGKRAFKKQCGVKDTNATQEQVDDWKACQDDPLDEIADLELAEYLIGTSTLLKLPVDYWPDDHGSWTVECIDTHIGENGIEVVCSMQDGPVKKDVGTITNIPVSSKRDSDYSIRRAIRENYSSAKTPRDVFEVQAHFARLYGEWTGTSPVSSQQCDSKWKPTTVNKPSLAVVALFALQTLAWAAVKNVCEGLDSPLSAKPKSQRDARSRPDWEQWKIAEEAEIGMCYEKGVFEIVDLPAGVKELPSMFQYALKTGPNGEFVKCKARICA